MTYKINVYKVYIYRINTSFYFNFKCGKYMFKHMYQITLKVKPGKIYLKKKLKSIC